MNDENVVSVKGPKGEMSQAVHPSIKVEIVDSEIVFTIDEQNDSVEISRSKLSTVCIVLWFKYGCRCFRRLCEEVGTCGCGFPCQQSGQLD